MSALTETPKEFVERLGCSKGLVSQYAAEGMPHARNDKGQVGGILVVEALRWIAANKPNSKTAPRVPELLAALGAADDTTSTKAEQPPQAPAAPRGLPKAIDHGDQGPDGDIDADSLTEAKRLHEIEKIRRARIAKDKDRGVLIERDLVRRGLHEFAMTHRDSWIAWCSRAAPDVAADLGVDLGRAFAVLNKLVRQQLIDMADAPLPPSLKGVADGE